MPPRAAAISRTVSGAVAMLIGRAASDRARSGYSAQFHPFNLRQRARGLAGTRHSIATSGVERENA